MAIARDAAACGYSSIIIEREPVIGGVWAKNDYPGLRLHQLGANYRCLSLAPPWQDSDGDVLYRPAQAEILEYIQQMAAHPQIAVHTETLYQGHEADGMADCKRVLTDAGAFRCRALVFAIGTYEVTSGAPHMPFDPAQVTNGACVMHSSNLEARKAEFGRAKTKYIVGASKAALAVLRNLDPRDESICWLHRGHVIFFNRDAMESDDSLQAMHRPWPPERIAGTATANTALKHQHFGPYEKMLLSTGKGHRVGAPHASQPQSRGGVEDEATIAHARRFLPRQRIMSSFYCEDGALHIACFDKIFGSACSRCSVLHGSFLGLINHMIEDLAFS